MRVSTKSRSTIAGAGRSTGSIPAASISGPPSIGTPSAFTVRPSNLSPTGTLATEPVPRTRLPALMPLSSPSIAHPIRSGSSVSTIPTTGSPPSDRSNSSSSPSRASGSPRTLATLSPTRSTRPIKSRRGSALS